MDGYIIVLFIGFALLCGLLAVGCAQLPSADTGQRYLENLGYEHVQYTGRSPFAEISGCSDKDVAVLHYRALNPRNQPVSVDVCQGWPLGGAHMRTQ